MDLDFLAANPVDVDVADSFDPTERRLDQGLGDVGLVLNGRGDVEDQVHDGNVILIPSTHVDLFEVIRHVRHQAIHPITQIRVSGLQIDVGLEGDADEGPPGAEVAVDFFDAAYGTDHVLDRAGYFFFNIAGTGGAIIGKNSQAFLFHTLGKERHGNAGVGDDA